MPAPSLCVVSGVVYDENGVPAVGVQLFLKRVLLNGVLIGTAPIGTASIPQLAGGDHTIQYVEVITSIAGGVVSFTVPQLSTVYLEGNVSGYNNGEIALSIPATATSTLEALTPATFPIDVTTFTFLSLVDTPNDFTGQALKNVRVNAAGTALEFAAPVVVDNETVQDALSAFFPDAAPFDWTYDDAGDRVTLAILDATASARGLMSTAYAARLDQLEVGDSPTFAGLTLTGPLLAPDGGLSTPSYSFTSAPTVGLRMRSSGSTAMDFVSGGVNAIEFGPVILRVGSGAAIGWSSTADAQVASDTGLARRAAAVARITNGGTGSGQLLIGSSTDTIAAQLHTLSNAIGVIPLIAEGPAGQTANLFEARVNGTAVLVVPASGGITTPSGNIITTSGVVRGSIIDFPSATRMSAPSDGVLLIRNNGSTDFNRLQFGGTTSSFPALKRSTTILQGKLADDSDFCPIQGKLRSHANVTAETPTATHTLRLFDAAGTEYKVLCVAA